MFALLSHALHHEVDQQQSKVQPVVSYVSPAVENKGEIITSPSHPLHNY